MARHIDYETQLRDFHAQRFSLRTMARILHLSTSTVARRLSQLGLAAPADSPPRGSTKQRSHGHLEIPEKVLNDLHELVDWWRDRRGSPPPVPEGQPQDRARHL